MSASTRSLVLKVLDRALIGALLLFTMMLLGVQLARPAELVPAVGVTRAVAGSDGARAFASLALRGSLAPMLQSEIGLAYRSDSYAGGDLVVRSWPVTASLWLSPLPVIYAGGGVGWYNTTLDYRGTLPIPSMTEQQFGTHLGGGLRIPVLPIVALDLGGRYVFLKEQQSPLLPQRQNPNFWTAAVGLALRF